MSVEEAWSLLKENIQNAQTLYVPNKYINENKPRPCTLPHDDTLHSLLKNKRYLFKINKKYGTKLSLYTYHILKLFKNENIVIAIINISVIIDLDGTSRYHFAPCIP